ncbi:MAG: hypothetical protein E5X67_21040 [Mesorhizobium sp.]|uniref:hypothetical protein n=1 Tax=Mesorhizobium sp. TaxID=1871066 RepID=UPI00120FD787|nr:hypothetical protein [Mesorhizobium sp.]TIP26249.1 MAG: hypothetical protein E5X67_21040 [Mesorhizobium sp.]
MEYTSETLDSTTGEIVQASIGSWITITEYGETKGVGRKQVRDALSRLGILQNETDDHTPKHASFAERKHITRRRLTTKAVRSGLGKRIFSIVGQPFDVISPKGQAWIDQRWADAVQTIKTDITSSPVAVAAQVALSEFMVGRRHRLDPEGQVRWLLDHHPNVAQADMSRITGASPRMISHYVSNRTAQISKAKAQIRVTLKAPLRMSYQPSMVDIECRSDTGADGSPSP